MIYCLYIDDEAPLLTISKEFLELHGSMKVLTCDSPVKVPDMCHEFKFDVIVSDYEMPGMNGIELFKKLRAEGVETPFILFTGRGREEVAIGALNAGIDFYLNKGGDPRSQFAELENTIAQLVRRKEAEESISYNARRFRHIIENVLDLVMIVDDEGRIEYASPSVSRSLKFRSEQLLGANARSFCHPDDRFLDTCRFRKMARTSKAAIEFRLRTSDGHYKWFEGVVRASPKEFGENRFIVNAWNIDERKNMELSIINKEKILRAIFDNAKEKHVIISLDGKIITANRRLCEVIGATMEELVGTHVLDLVAPPYKEAASKQLESRARGNEDPNTYRLSLQCRNGKEQPVLVYSRLINNQGEEPLIIITGSETFDDGE
jgi:PAS domain S-box-containing protein